MLNQKYKKSWIIYTVLLMAFLVSLYESIHIIPENKKALVHQSKIYFSSYISRKAHSKSSGLIFIIPFFESVRLYTEMVSGEFNAYKPKLTIIYSYEINQSHMNEFHFGASSDHYFIQFQLSARINRHLTEGSSQAR